MKKFLKMISLILVAYVGKAVEATIFYVALVRIPYALIGALWGRFARDEPLEQGEEMMLAVPLFLVVVGVAGIAIKLAVSAGGAIADRFSWKEGAGDDALTLAVLEAVAFLMSAAGLAWLLCRAFSRIA